MIALEFTTFIGRFHPLLVHLPIGFILLAVVLEWWEVSKKIEAPNKLIPVAWFIGGLSAFTAALCGWYLGETGLYEKEQIFVHRWLGIALIPIAFAGWWIKRKSQRFPKPLQNGFNILLIILLSIEGHKGGNLTHGEGYLTKYAPEFMQILFASKKDTVSRHIFDNPDSTLVFANLIQPILKTKCVSCHGNKIKKGALNMSHPDSLQLGGEGGPVIIARDPEESELFRRITLQRENVKFMPPTRSVLNYDEIKIIEWWISQGASFEKTVSQLDVDNYVKPVLLRHYGLNTEPRPWYQKVQIPPLESGVIRDLKAKGFTVKTLGATNPLLDISYSGNDLTHDIMAALAPAKNHITWFSLTETNVEDEWLSSISNFANLTRLELDKTAISDKGIDHLKRLQHLEVLNLYASHVSDASLSVIQELPELKRVYLSRTKVTLGKAKATSKDKDDLTIIIAESDEK